MNTGEDIFKEKRLSLKITDSSLIPILKRIGYLDFIKQIIEHLNYDADLLPIFTSQVEESMVSLFDKMVRAYKKNVTVFFDESLPAVIIQAPIGMLENLNKIVIYSMFDTLGFKLQAKDLGAQGFISKASSDEKLVTCLNTVKNGGTYYEENDLSIQKELDSIVPFLKENERRVFELVLQGKSNDQIKDDLFLGLHTVENYVSYILNISNCKNRKQLIENFCLPSF